MKIRGEPVEYYDVVKRLVSERSVQLKSALFPVIFEAVWFMAMRYELNAVGVVAQAAHETNWGRFTGNVPPEFFNTAGIKIKESIRRANWGIAGEDLPFAHAQFGNWYDGAKGQCQHLSAYLGLELPAEDITHARYYDVLANVRRVGVKTVHFSDLGGVGSWAPGTDYGARVESIARTLIEIG